MSLSELEHRTPFGLYIGPGEKNGTILHAAEVANGLSCDCICPCCEGRLMAAQGEKRRAHFRHYRPDSLCGGGYESALHLFAKQVLSTGPIWLPPIATRRFKVSDWVSMNPDRSVMEYHLANFRSDLVVWQEQEACLVEVWVTHRVDDEKKEKIVEAGVPCIEVDLSGYSALGKSLTEVREDILFRARRYWLYHPKLWLLRELEDEHRRLAALGRRLKQVHSALAFWQQREADRQAFLARASITARSRKAESAPRSWPQPTLYRASESHYSESESEGMLLHGWLLDGPPPAPVEPSIEISDEMRPWIDFVEWHAASMRQQ